MRNLIDPKTRVVLEHKRINLPKLNYRKQIRLRFIYSFRSVFRLIPITSRLKVIKICIRKYRQAMFKIFFVLVRTAAS